MGTYKLVPQISRSGKLRGTETFVSVEFQTLSLPSNSDGLENLIQSTETDSGTIAVSESTLIKDNLPPLDINLLNYCMNFV